MSRPPTPKQRLFAQTYVATGNATEAYRTAYNPRPTTKPESVVRAAKEVMDNPNVASMVEQLLEQRQKKAEITIDMHIARLGELAEEARARGQMSAAVNAETQRGKALGFYRERVEVTGADGGPMQFGEVERAARLSSILALVRKRVGDG